MTKQDKWKKSVQAQLSSHGGVGERRGKSEWDASQMKALRGCFTHKHLRLIIRSYEGRTRGLSPIQVASLKCLLCVTLGGAVAPS